jgi:hypothetical protein
VPRQEQIHHGKSKFITAKANSSRQKQIHHGKSKLVTAKQNHITGQRFCQRLLHLPL